MTAPPIRYATNGDIHLAYQTIGEGPRDLVLVQGAITNLEVLWDIPEYRTHCEQLASFSRLILFDKRGMGLSDRVRVGTLEERMDDVRAIMDDADSESAALMGVSEGGPMSMLFAATYPERTQALVLCGAEVKEETTEDWPWGESTREQMYEYTTIENVLAALGQRRCGRLLRPQPQRRRALARAVRPAAGAVREPARRARVHADGLRDRRPPRCSVDQHADADRAPHRRRRRAMSKTPAGSPGTFVLRGTSSYPARITSRGSTATT